MAVFKSATRGPSLLSDRNAKINLFRVYARPATGISYSITCTMVMIIQSFSLEMFLMHRDVRLLSPPQVLKRAYIFQFFVNKVEHLGSHLVVWRVMPPME